MFNTFYKVLIPHYKSRRATLSTWGGWELFIGRDLGVKAAVKCVQMDWDGLRPDWDLSHCKHVGDK